MWVRDATLPVFHVSRWPTGVCLRCAAAALVEPRQLGDVQLPAAQAAVSFVALIPLGNPSGTKPSIVKAL